MTLTKWNESIRIAKIKMGLDPKSYIMIKGKLLKRGTGHLSNVDTKRKIIKQIGTP